VLFWLCLWRSAPPQVISIALKAANLIGDGFYGVDLKQVGSGYCVIEVNDNPSVDAGNEDGVLKDALYLEVMSVFARRMAQRRQPCHDRLAAPLSAFSGYGIELEYMIVDRDSLAVLPIADELLRKVCGSYTTHRRNGRFGWSNELVLHVVEIKNPSPEAHLDGLAAGFQAEIERINELLAEFGAQLMPGAMHPWMNPATETRLWPHQNDAIYRTYDRHFRLPCAWLGQYPEHARQPALRQRRGVCAPARRRTPVCCRSCQRSRPVPRWRTGKPAKCLIFAWRATASIRPAFRR
jgi:hypothetical protein